MPGRRPSFERDGLPLAKLAAPVDVLVDGVADGFVIARALQRDARDAQRPELVHLTHVHLQLWRDRTALAQRFRNDGVLPLRRRQSVSHLVQNEIVDSLPLGTPSTPPASRRAS